MSLMTENSDPDGPTIWVRCACGSEMLSSHRWATRWGEGRFELAIWMRGHWSLGWRDRLRRAWAALRGKDLWHDEIMLTPEDALGLANWIIVQTVVADQQAQQPDTDPDKEVPHGHV